MIPTHGLSPDTISSANAAPGKIAAQSSRRQRQHIRRAIYTIGREDCLKNCPRAIYTNQQGANKGSSHIRRELSDREGKSQCPKPGDEKGNHLDKAIAAQH